MNHHDTTAQLLLDLAAWLLTLKPHWRSTACYGSSAAYRTPERL